MQYIRTYTLKPLMEMSSRTQVGGRAVEWSKTVWEFSKWVFVFFMCYFLPRHECSVVLKQTLFSNSNHFGHLIMYLSTFSVRSSFILWASQDRSLGLVFVSSPLDPTFSLPLYSLVVSSNLRRASFCTYPVFICFQNIFIFLYIYLPQEMNSYCRAALSLLLPPST